jgi:hypothetical protein
MCLGEDSHGHTQNHHNQILCVRLLEDSPHMVPMNNQEDNLKREKFFIFKNYIIPPLTNQPIFFSFQKLNLSYIIKCGGHL